VEPPGKSKPVSDAWYQSEAFYRSLVAVSPYAVTVTELDGTITYASQRTCEVYGCASPDELIGKNAFELVAPEDHELARRNLERTIVDGQIDRVEYLLRRQDGTTYPGELSAAVIKDEAGQPRAFIATTADLSHHKEVERALQDSETRFRDLADLLPQVIYEMDSRGNLLFASRVGLEGLGLDPEGFAEGKRNFADLLVPGDVERSRQNVSALLAGEEIGSNEYTIVNDRDERVPVAIYSAPVLREGEMVGLRGVVVDISARKRAEEELQRLNQELERRVAKRTAQLEAANQELESFSYSISHDLRSPLATIEGFGQALLEDYGERIGAEGRGYVDRMLAAGGRMQQLIEDLLRLAGVTRGELRREEVDLSALAQMVATRVGQATPERALQLTIQPDLLVDADAQLLLVLLENLLGNAWKFTACEASAEVEVGKLADDEQRFHRESDEAIYFVRDNGVGFDVAQAKQLFQPFQRFHRSDDFPGTGIGLATVQRIVARHGGRVWAESAPGEGTTIFFTL